MIAAKVANALALDWPREQLELIVACDGCTDDTAARARAAGADLVLELPRGGKVRAQDAAVRARRRRAPRVLRRQRDLGAGRAARARRAPSPTRASATPAGRSASSQGAAGAHADNQEGVYWRYEMAVRALESRLRSITAGNGAIYATRRDAYLVVDPSAWATTSRFPFNMVKRGWRAVYVPERARQREDGAVARGRVRAQAADDEPRLADRAARRHALAARLRPRYG